MRNREYAHKSMAHYLKQVYVKAGLSWDWEMESEVHSLVDYIIDAAKEELKEEMEEKTAAV